MKNTGVDHLKDVDYKKIFLLLFSRRGNIVNHCQCCGSQFVIICSDTAVDGTEIWLLLTLFVVTSITRIRGMWQHENDSRGAVEIDGRKRKLVRVAWKQLYRGLNCVGRQIEVVIRLYGALINNLKAGFRLNYVLRFTSYCVVVNKLRLGYKNQIWISLVHSKVKHRNKS